MNYKLKSVKLWLLVALIAFTGFLNYGGTISGSEYINFIQWAFGFFLAANVGTKITGKKER